MKRYLAGIFLGIVVLASAPVWAGDFADNDNDTVTDKVTGAVWTKSANLTRFAVSFEKAKEVAADCKIGGYSWRLPTTAEFQSIWQRMDWAKFSNIITIFSSYWADEECGCSTDRKMCYAPGFSTKRFSMYYGKRQCVSLAASDRTGVVWLIAKPNISSKIAKK